MLEKTDGVGNRDSRDGRKRGAHRMDEMDEQVERNEQQTGIWKQIADGFSHRTLRNAWTFMRWIFFSCLIGVVVGVVGVGFHHAVAVVTEWRGEYPYILFGLPVIGLFIVWMYRACDMARDGGTNLVLISVRDNAPIRLRTAPLIIIATVLTHLFGGSSGREGAALQLGSSISASVGRLMRLDDKDERVFKMCGMAAGFSALFGTPLAAAVFAMEVVSVGVMYYAAMFPCLLASLVALMTARALGGVPEAFLVYGIPQLTPLALGQVIVLGLLCALVAVLFCKVLGIIQRLYARYLPHSYVRVFVGGCIVVVLTLLLGTRDYNGAGMPVIWRAFTGYAHPAAFLIKMVLTALTLGAGFKGGEIVPAFFVGSTFGCYYGGFLGLSGSFAAGVGMVAVFCGVTNCPLTSILLAYELFGGDGLLLFALGCAVSYMFSGYSGLYSAQKIMYSKLRPEFIARQSGE